jgi:hypothetical protein
MDMSLYLPAFLASFKKSTDVPWGPVAGEIENLMLLASL